jgi:hypothetical protein
MRIAPSIAAGFLVALPLLAVGQEGAPADAGPAATPQAQGAPSTPVEPAGRAGKSGGYFGVSLGTGKGTLQQGSSSVSVNDLFAASGRSPQTLALQLRGGWGSGDLLLGSQMNLTRTWVDAGGTSYGLQFASVDLVATWWSQSDGLYARVGLGPSEVSAFGGNSRTSTSQGVELMAGLGVTLGSLGVGLDLTRQTYKASETGFDSVTYVLASLSLDVY